MAFGYPLDTASGSAGQLMKKAGLNNVTPSNISDGVTGGVLTFSAALGGNITITLPTSSSSLIGGSLAVNQVAYGSATNAIQGSAGFTFASNLLTVSANTGTITPIAETVVDLLNANASSTRLVLSAAGANSFAIVTGRRARNTAASPQAVQSGDLLLRVDAFGYGTTGYSSAARGIFEFIATETWSDTSQGSASRILVTPNGGASTAEVMRFYGDGGVQIGGSFGTSPGIFKLLTAATTSTNAGLNLPHGTAPASPVNGDLWTTTAGIFARINGSTAGPFGAGAIGGSIAVNQVAFASGSNTLTGSASLTFTDAAGGLLTLARKLSLSLTDDTVVSTAAAITSSYSGTTVNPSAITALTLSASTTSTGTPGADTVEGLLVSHSVGQTSPAFTICRGIRVSGGAFNSSTVTNVFSTHLTAISQNGSAVTSMYGVYIKPDTRTGSTVGTFYGVYIDSPTNAAVITSEYGVYQASTTALNYFFGDTGIGIAPGATTFLNLGVSTTAKSSVRIGHGAAPTSPINGDIWTTTSGFFVRINSATQQMNFSGIGGSIATAQIAFGASTNTLTGTDQWQAGIITGGNVTEYFAPASAFVTNGTQTVRDSSMTVNGLDSGIFSGQSMAVIVNNTHGATGSGTVYRAANHSITVNPLNNSNLALSAVIAGDFSATHNLTNALNNVNLLTLAPVRCTPSVVMTGGSSISTVTNVYGVLVEPGTFSTASGGALTITNYYGLRLKTVTTSGAGTTTITNMYGIYQDDAAATNLFAGVILANGGVTIGSGQDLKLGNAYVNTPQVPTGYIVIKDSTGTAYKVSVNT